MTRAFISLAACSLAVAACSQSAATEQPADTATSTAPTASAPAERSPKNPTETLTLDGLGDLVIGEPVPGSSTFKLRGAQASDSCLIYTSPSHPGVYAIVEGGNLRRVTISRESNVKLVEGIGVGAAEMDVLAAFPGFKSEPHKYVSAPAKYLTQPGDDPRLRFEIGEDGRVTDIHVGLAPQLLYVEGCS